ncbi:MAG: hypothetical protein ACYCQJ_01700 [Nitrososphaerales archaeon]
MEKEPFAKQINKLKEEIDSWAPFVESLRLEDRQVFRKMIENTWNYSDSIEICKDEYTTEAFLISILISQQKTINFLSKEMEILRESR